MIDEIDEIVASVPGAGTLLEFLASKQRKIAVCLILATQRATQKQTGGGMVRANLSPVVIGNTTGPPNPGTPPARKRDPRHQRVLPRPARATSRSGTRRPRRSPPAGARSCSACPRTSWPTASASWTPAEHQARAPRGRARRARPAGARSRTGGTGRERDAGEAGGGQGAQREDASCRRRSRAASRCAAARGHPAADAQALLALLGEPEGTSAGPAGAAIGKSKATAWRYLNMLREHGIAELVTAGRSSRYRLAGQPGPRPEPLGKGTGRRVPDHPGPRRGRARGLADADEATREVLEKVWEIEHRPPGRT